MTRLRPNPLPMINIGQAEVGLLIVSFLNMCVMLGARGGSSRHPAGAQQQGGFTHYLAPGQLEANQTDRPTPARHRPNDFHIKLPDVRPRHPPIPFPYRSAPK